MASTFENTFFDRAVPALERAFGVTVTLSDGTYTSDSFTARRNDYEYEVFGQDTGMPVKATGRMFRFAVTSVVLNSSTVDPQEGHRITEGSEVFEIMAAEGKPAVELVSGGDEWEVRTKRVA